MGLPDLISIDPIDRLSVADVVVPGSKSITNRVLVLAVQKDSETRLQGALWSEDTRVMVECLQQLGYNIKVLPDAGEPSNRTLIVRGQGAVIPGGGTETNPLDLFVGNAGTAARFLLAFLCLGSGVYRLHGVPRMHERPQAALIQSLRELGYQLDTPNDRLPVLIHGGGAREATCDVDISASSQFASALLLSSELGKWTVRFHGKPLSQSPYVKMTQELVKEFDAVDSLFQIEPDASSGSYFWAVNALGIPVSSDSSLPLNGATVSVKNWPRTGWQIDAEFPRFLDCSKDVSRDRDLGDSIMTSIVLAAVAKEQRRFVDLGRLRVQECERVVALRTELGRCGIEVIEEGDSLTVTPGALRPADIETYDDHRMAMCFAVLGLKAAGIRLKDPHCVKKTFPNFFQKLATQPPNGIGAVIRNGLTGEILSGDDLMAS